MAATQLGEYLKQQFLQGQGIVTQEAGAYNPRIERFSGGVNKGTDIAVPVGTPVVLPQGNWRIEDVYGGAQRKGFIGNNDNSGWGNSVVARNTDTGQTYRFSHLLRPLVQKGQTLQGGKIALTGNTGNSTGAHLDIEVGGFAGALKNISQNVGKYTPRINYRKSKINPQDLLRQVQSKFGKNVIGISSNPKLLEEARKKYGGTIRKIRI